jgi:hypothetical protein
MALSAMPPCSICMNADDGGSIRFSLGHFLGFTDAVMLFVAILPVTRRWSLTPHIKLREMREHYQNIKGESVCLFF